MTSEEIFFPGKVTEVIAEGKEVDLSGKIHQQMLKTESVLKVVRFKCKNTLASHAQKYKKIEAPGPNEPSFGPPASVDLFPECASFCKVEVLGRKQPLKLRIFDPDYPKRLKLFDSVLKFFKSEQDLKKNEPFLTLTNPHCVVNVFDDLGSNVNTKEVDQVFGGKQLFISISSG